MCININRNYRLQQLYMLLVINQLNAQFLFYNKFISCLYMFRSLCAHHQEVKMVLYSIWYHHTKIVFLMFIGPCIIMIVEE